MSCLDFVKSGFKACSCLVGCSLWLITGKAEQERAKEYSNYQLVYQRKERERKVTYNYLMKKEGRASGSISFLELRKWFKRYWGIDL